MASPESHKLSIGWFESNTRILSETRMYYTVYKTINKINGKFYIGVHATNKPEDTYLGSGSLIKKAIKKYGKDNFIKEIIKVCSTSEEMYAIEAELVCQEQVDNRLCYNVKLGGEGGFDWINRNRDKLDFSNKNTDTSAASKKHLENTKVKKQLYYDNPKTCKYCNTVIPYKKRMNKFCNRSCSATHNNLLRSSK